MKVASKGGEEVEDETEDGDAKTTTAPGDSGSISGAKTGEGSEREEHSQDGAAGSQSDVPIENKAATGPNIGEWEVVKPGEYSAFASCGTREEEIEGEAEEEPYTEAGYLKDLRWDIACQGPLHRDDLEPLEKPVYHPLTGEETGDLGSAAPVAFKKAKKIKVHGLRKLTAE